MIITCESCNTSFNLDDKMIKPTGSKVRCSVCTKVFTVYPQQTPPHEPVIDSKSSNADNGLEAGLATEVPASTMPNETAQPDASHAPETEIPDQDAEAFFDEDSDLDFSLDDDLENGTRETEIEINDDLKDDDLNFDLSPEHADDAEAATMIADLDAEDLDLSLDEQTAEVETVMVDLDDEDFDLETPFENDAASEGATAIVSNLDEDALEIDDDFALESEERDASGESGNGILPDMADELGDLDLTLDLEPREEAPNDGKSASKPADIAMDELSLEFDLEETGGETTEDSAEDDLDLMLDLDDEGIGEKEPESNSMVFADDLDLSGLEEMLKDDVVSEDDAATVVVDEDDASELVLELDDGAPSIETDQGDAEGESLEDLELDLNSDDIGEPVSADTADGVDPEIDLSEIEKMLEEPETGSTQFSSMPEQDLDLNIEASLETEKWMSDSNEDGQLIKDEELDLSELEQVLEDVDIEGGDDKEAEEPELELDLEENSRPETATETVAADNELDFDLSDFELEVPPTRSAPKAPRQPDDMELEFEVEEDGQADHTQEDEGLEATVAIPEKKEEIAKAAQPVPTTASVMAPKPEKKGMSKSLVFILIIAILGGLAYGTYYLLNQNGIEIPFLSDYLKPKVPDPGNLRLTTYDINSRFVDNANIGKLFVISGKVKNGYPDSRGMITLMGKIFSTGKVTIQEQKVYCGNVMSDLELANLEWDKIKSRLSNRLGDNRSNVKVEPGKSIPFMVVFSGLPDDLEEFTIEVTGSTTLK